MQQTLERITNWCLATGTSCVFTIKISIQIEIEIYIGIGISLSIDRWMDRGLTGVAADVANVGANYDLVLSRHRCAMRVYL